MLGNLALSMNTSDPAWMVVGIELGENTHTDMFAEGLSIRGNTREDPKCLSGEWSENSGDDVTKEYGTVNKRKFGLRASCEIQNHILEEEKQLGP